MNTTGAKVNINYALSGEKWELLASIADACFQMAMNADILRAAAMHVGECTPELNTIHATLTALGHHYNVLAATNADAVSE